MMFDRRSMFLIECSKPFLLRSEFQEFSLLIIHVSGLFTSILQFCFKVSSTIFTLQHLLNAMYLYMRCSILFMVAHQLAITAHLPLLLPCLPPHCSPVTYFYCCTGFQHPPTHSESSPRRISFLPAVLNTCMRSC